MELNPFNGPIPGENYLRDTKNLPWHRPPEFTDLDKAIESSMEKLTSEDGSIGIITMIELGMSIADLTEIFVMSGVSQGKWTVDMAVLMAGPVSHIMCLMAKGYGIEYDLGLEGPNIKYTKAYFDEIGKLDQGRLAGVAEDVQEQLPEIQEQAQASGFMSMTEQTSEEL